MNRMSMPSWDRIKAVFAEACELPGEQVPAFLDRVCEGDAELRREVDSLLAARSGKQVATGGAARELAAASTMRSAIISEGAGTIIGPYKLLQLIGEGGFGSVFLAEQTQPVRRRVAVKIIKLGMDTKQVIARFEAERQALALMDHPHIAKVLDGGATPLTERGGGRPYFVMEYVVGDAITAFADAHKLTIRDRLDLFQQVCSAVQHAHTKGIIHRDLKPGNVLVTMVDGKPFAKVIDFGIAKATAGPGGLTDKTLFTEHRQLIGTPEYMSPEQAEGSPDIDTRTDVYALGVLLYELLTGETPFDGARLRSAAYAEIQRIIKDEEPPSPSQRLSRLLDTIAATAAARQLEPDKLRASVHGELDWIVMRALDKERGRRYESASSLADDVRRHLAGEAVVAAPVSKGYRLRKFVRKNRGPVVAVSAVMLALLAGGSLAGWQWKEARHANGLLEHLAQTAFTEFLNAATQSSSKLGEIPATTAIGFEIDDRREVFVDFSGASVGMLRYSIRSLDPRSDVEEPKTFAQQELTWSVGQPIPPSEDASVLIQALARWQVQTDQGRRIAQATLLSRTDAAEWSAYTANIALAIAAAREGAMEDARAYVNQLPATRDGWERQVVTRWSQSLLWTAWAFGGPIAFSDDASQLRYHYSVRQDSLGGWSVSNGAQIPSSAQRPPSMPVLTMTVDGRISTREHEWGNFYRQFRHDESWAVRSLIAQDFFSYAVSRDFKYVAWFGVGDDDSRNFGSAVEPTSFRLKLAPVESWGGPIRHIRAETGSDQVRLTLRVATILASSPNGPSGLTITIPDGTRRIVGNADKTVRFYEAKDGKPTLPATADSPEGVYREVAVFRMPEAVTNLQMTGDGTRLIIHLEGGSARVWDIRDPEERRKDFQAEWAERVPAGAYLDTLWASDTSDDKLRDAVFNDASLTPLRRLVAVEMLEERVEDDRLAVARAFAAITKDQTDKAAVQAAAAARTDLSKRVHAQLIAKAAEWDYKPAEPSESERFAEERKQRLLAETELSIEAIMFERSAERASDLERLRTGIAKLTNLAGSNYRPRIDAIVRLAYSANSLVDGRWERSVSDEAVAMLADPARDDAYAASALALCHSLTASRSEEPQRSVSMGAAREAIVHAKSLMLPAADGTPSPSANDEDAKAFIAEAESLIGGAP